MHFFSGAKKRQGKKFLILALFCALKSFLSRHFFQKKKAFLFCGFLALLKLYYLIDFWTIFLTCLKKYQRNQRHIQKNVQCKYLFINQGASSIATSAKDKSSALSKVYQGCRNVSQPRVSRCETFHTNFHIFIALFRFMILIEVVVVYLKSNCAKK